MVDIFYEAPLKIPEGTLLRPMRSRGYDHGFPRALALDDAVAYLEEELRGLPISRARVYTNLERLNSPKIRRKMADDAAVLVEIGIDKRRFYLLCDRWAQIEYNLYALHLTLRALNNIEKWGVTTMANLLQAFSAGHRSTEPGQSEISTRDATSEEYTNWMQMLGLGPTASLDDANAIYRHRAKMLAENGTALQELNEAIAEARKHLK